MSDKRYNVALIGYGLSAKIFNIPFIVPIPTLHLYGIVQRHPTPDDDAAKDFPGVKTWRSSEEMLQDEQVDVVVVTTIPGSHFDLAKMALEKGKHVVVEKPFVPTRREAEELRKVAERVGRLCTVFQNRRFDSDFLTLSHLIHTNALGRLTEFETHFDRHQPSPPSTQTWRSEPLPGGGLIYDLGAHLLDQALALFGMPRRVTAFVTNQRAGGGNEQGDSFTVVLQYEREEGGLMVTAKAAVVSPEVEQLRFWARGEEGSFKKYHLDCQEDQLKAGMRPGDAGYGVEPESHHGTLTRIKSGEPFRETYPTLEPATYTEYYRRFAKALAGEGEAPVTLEEASNLIRLIELAKESSRLGKTMDV